MKKQVKEQQNWYSIINSIGKTVCDEDGKTVYIFASNIPEATRKMREMNRNRIGNFSYWKVKREYIFGSVRG